MFAPRFRLRRQEVLSQSPRHTLRPRQRNGAMAVEFALTAPLVILLFFAALEFTRLNVIRNSADNAAYEGARQGIIPGATAASCQVEAQRLLSAIGVRGATITVTPAVILPDTPRVTVDIDIPFNLNAYFASLFFGGRSMSSSCVLTREIAELAVVP